MTVRYYISSADLTAEKFATAIRNHWHVENKLHWRLDVVMNEDDGNDSNLLIVFYVQIMPDDFVMQLHRF